MAGGSVTTFTVTGNENSGSVDVLSRSTGFFRTPTANTAGSVDVAALSKLRAGGESAGSRDDISQSTLSCHMNIQISGYRKTYTSSTNVASDYTTNGADHLNGDYSADYTLAPWPAPGTTSASLVTLPLDEAGAMHHGGVVE